MKRLCGEDAQAFQEVEEILQTLDAPTCSVADPREPNRMWMLGVLAIGNRMVDEKMSIIPSSSTGSPWEV